MCEMRTARDFVISGRQRPATARGEDFSVPDSEYADDTALPFPARCVLEKMAPLLMKHFERWNMEIHSRALGSAKGSKPEVLFCAAPPRCYSNPATFDGADLSDIQLPDGRSMPVVDKFCYLGSWITRYCGNALDVDSRLESAGKAFGALRQCIFRSTSMSFEAKCAVYERIVFSIGLFGCECWCLSEVLWRRLRCFPMRSACVLCAASRASTPDTTTSQHRNSGRGSAWSQSTSTWRVGRRAGLGT